MEFSFHSDREEELFHSLFCIYSFVLGTEKPSHVHLTLKIDFEKKLLSGDAILTVKIAHEGVESVSLNAKQQKIHSITDEVTGLILSHHKDGENIKVILPKTNLKEIKIRISYTIASGLVWLEPSQTAGKKKPFVFSQGWGGGGYICPLFPCQHTNLVKTTFSADIIAPSWTTVLMSAASSRHRLQTHSSIKFKQDKPISSYLVAIAAGDVQSKKLGPRTSVWAESQVLDTAGKDFAETENMLKNAEAICGPYLWKKYDILVLPPAFAYGGMENPCMTYASPTLVTGDKANTDVIAHEIAHSWSGNLVTNSNEEHFWLNEGLTSFIEGKILGRMHGETTRHLSAIFLWRKLEADVKEKYNKTALVGATMNGDYTNVVYGKGMALAWYLEDTVGGPTQFEPFLKAYFKEFTFQSIKTEDFKYFFIEYFYDVPAVAKIDWNTWLYKPGMPIYKPNFDYSLVKECSSLANFWQTFDVQDKAIDYSKIISRYNKMNGIQKQEFFEILLDGEPLGMNKANQMGRIYSLDTSTNPEIMMRWWRIGIKSRIKSIAESALKKVQNYGRIRIILFIYKDLYGWEEMRSKTVETFLEHKHQLMDHTVSIISKILNIGKKSRRRTYLVK